VIGRATFVPTGLEHPNPETGQGNLAASWTFGCQGVDLEVDLATGRLDVLRLVSAQDPGTVVNPDTARGQVEGALLMGLGAALMEKIKFSPEGRILNPSLVDYRILTTSDTPTLEVIFVETADASGPYGARGLGEHGIVAVPAAIANALAGIFGQPFSEIPITQEMVYDAIETMKGGG
jgi:carbon-monoxide dehydrogenase large subunit